MSETKQTGATAPAAKQLADKKERNKARIALGRQGNKRFGGIEKVEEFDGPTLNPKPGKYKTKRYRKTTYKNGVTKTALIATVIGKPKK